MLKSGLAASLLVCAWLVTPPDALDEYVRAQMAARQIPGLQLAIVQRGRVPVVRNYGIASVELDVPVHGDTVFAVNSIAKAFTGVAAMRLAEAGRLDLAAPVERYLTDLPVAWRGVTIQQLLSHMSGLPDVVRAPTVESNAAAAWEWVQAQPVLFAPGERFHYCQTNYALLQRVIDGLRGTTGDSSLASEQIQLAGMRRTRFGDSLDVIPQKAPTYRLSRTASQPPVLQAVVERFLPFRYGASGLNSTATELADWLVALTSDRLLSRASRERMWTPVRFTNGTTGQWGLGWQVLTRNTHRAVGLTGGGRAAFYYYPEHDTGVVILTNLAGAYPEDMIDAIVTMFAPIELTGVPALRRELEAEGFDKAPAVASRLKAGAPSEKWNELELNDWGYRLMATGRLREATAVFRVAVGMFPMSGNAHDSLGEALAREGDVNGAIAHYRQSLALDPGNTNAARQLERLLKSRTPGQ